MIVILGVISALQLPIAQYPQISPPTIGVSTSYTGANASVVNQTIAQVIEQQVNGTQGMYGEGVSKEGSIIDIAADMDILEKSGSWYSYGGSRLGQGKETVKDILKQNPPLRDEIEGKIRSKIKEDKAKLQAEAEAKKAAAAEVAAKAEAAGNAAEDKE